MRPSQVLSEGREVVRAALSDAHPGTRAFAAHRAVELGLDTALLAPLLGDENWVVRGAAACALSRASEADPATCGALARLLGDDELMVRRHAVQALGQVGDASVVDALVAELHSGDPDLAAAAVVALGAIGDARAVEPLLKALPREDLLSAVVQALGAIGDERAVASLITRFCEGVGGIVEWYIVAALSAIGDHETIFEAMANHHDPETRRMLGRVADTWWPEERAVLAIIAQMSDPAAVVRSGAAYRLRNSKLSADLTERVRAALERGQQDSDEDVRHWCEETLEEWSDGND